MRDRDGMVTVHSGGRGGLDANPDALKKAWRTHRLEEVAFPQANIIDRFDSVYEKNVRHGHGANATHLAS